MITTMFARFSNGETARVSLLFGKEIRSDHLTAVFITEGIFKMTPAPKFTDTHWEMFANAFRAVNNEPINGFTFDTSVSEGLVAIHKTKEGLEEMLNDAD